MTTRLIAPNRPGWLLLVLVPFLSVYVAAELTPSSYALALPAFGAVPRFISWGEPRGIRSDEWTVWTPYVQAAVRNHFHRYNDTSPYHEDLRNLNSLPLMDWGLLFKPYFWPFIVAGPSYAYSFFFAFQLFSFIYGYRQLFRRLGVAAEIATGGSLLLFFSGYTQYWWTTVGPSISLFPWVVLAAMLRHSWWKYFLFCYVVVAWIFAVAYPPIIIALSFVGLVLGCTFPAKQPAPLREYFLMIGTAVCAAGLIGLYYQDLLTITMQTVYPGHRRVSAGSEGIRLMMGMFSPAFNQDGYRGLGVPNICESGVVGSFLPVGLVAFSDYRSLLSLASGKMPSFSRTRAAILILAILSMLAWIFLPVPIPFGEIFLWQFVPGRRMLFPAGLLLLFLCLWLLSASGAVLTVRRIAGFFAIVLVSIFASKHLWSLAWNSTPRSEFLILPVLITFTFLARRGELSAVQAVVHSCVIANVALFGLFNPVLSAREIFLPRDTPVMRSLNQMQSDDPRGWLVTGGFPGAVLNGQGFRSIQHVLLSPHLEFFREFFPGMPKAEFEYIFNRYAHIRLGSTIRPFVLHPDVVIVPLAAFEAHRGLE